MVVVVGDVFVVVDLEVVDVGGLVFFLVVAGPPFINLTNCC